MQDMQSCKTLELKKKKKWKSAIGNGKNQIDFPNGFSLSNTQ